MYRYPTPSRSLAVGMRENSKYRGVHTSARPTKGNCTLAGSTPMTVDGHLVQIDRPAHDIRIALVARVPEGIAQDRHRLAFRPAIFGRKVAANRRLNAKQRKEIGRDARYGNLRRVVVAGQV